MHTIRDILRLSLEAKLTLNQIALAVRMSKSGVRTCLKRFKHSEMCYPLPAEMTDTELENALYPPKPSFGCQYQQPDWSRVITELSKPHVTLEPLYQEYLQTYPEKAMSRSSFYRYLNRYRLQHLPPVMRMRHKGGEKLFVDYSGDSLEYVIRETGELISTQLFIASWGASSYSFAEATHTQALPDWVASHNRAYAYFGCVPRVEVPDNTKTAVSRADFYDPEAPMRTACRTKSSSPSLSRTNSTPGTAENSTAWSARPTSSPNRHASNTYPTHRPAASRKKTS